MFNLGFPELMALGALALIVIGPKQLPEVAKVVARTLNELKRATKDITGTFAEVKADVRSSVDQIVNDVTSEVVDIEETINENVSDSIEKNELQDGKVHLADTQKSNKGDQG